jgi:hypothetical protein
MRTIAFVVMAGILLTSPGWAQHAPTPSTSNLDALAAWAPDDSAPPQARGTTPPPPPTPPPALIDSTNTRGLPNPAENVKLELAITDTYNGAPSSKTVSIVIANGSSGAVRTQNRLPDGNPVYLNIDAQARVYGGGVISVVMTFQYTPAQPAQGENRQRPADLEEHVSVLLQDGKSTVVSQSADPATDRKVTAQITATIVR